MYDEELEELNAWFEDDERAFDTGFNGEEYVVAELDIEDFCDFLLEQDPDLIGIPCMVGTGGIWFTKSDLDKASYL